MDHLHSENRVLRVRRISLTRMAELALDTTLEMQCDGAHMIPIRRMLVDEVSAHSVRCGCQVVEGLTGRNELAAASRAVTL